MIDTFQQVDFLGQSIPIFSCREDLDGHYEARFKKSDAMHGAERSVGIKNQFGVVECTLRLVSRGFETFLRDPILDQFVSDSGHTYPSHPIQVFVDMDQTLKVFGCGNANVFHFEGLFLKQRQGLNEERI